MNLDKNNNPDLPEKKTVSSSAAETKTENEKQPVQNDGTDSVKNQPDGKKNASVTADEKLSKVKDLSVLLLKNLAPIGKKVGLFALHHIWVILHLLFFAGVFVFFYRLPNLTIQSLIRWNSDKTALLQYPKWLDKPHFVVPPSVTEIGNNAFENCKLRSIELPKGLKRIGAEAFYGSQLENISIPENVESIGDNAFTRTTETVLNAVNSWYLKRTEKMNDADKFSTALLFLHGNETKNIRCDEQAAVRLISSTAAKGYAKAQFFMGDACLKGDIKTINKNLLEAVEWFRKAADQGHAAAQNKLGICYFNGTGVKKDPVEAVKWYRKAANQGHAAAQCNLGLCFDNGTGVKKDPVEAVKWYRKAAEHGDAAAQYNLGLCYYQGIGVKKDPVEAVKWYRKAADQGEADAQFTFAFCFDNGIGVKKDPAEAVKWYRKAADQGFANAQFNLGLCFENGTGVGKNPAEAVKWYRKAANQGHADAQFNLGVHFENGNGVEQDPAEAVKWYRKAADQGYAAAQCNLGACFENGIGVKKDPAEAVKWYRKAVDQGFAHAQCNLGVCYEFGMGVGKDPAEAVKWYRKAADQGYAQAQYNLGVCYEFGMGVPKKPFEAVRWYRKAADQGYARAQCNLSVCYANGTGIGKDPDEAVKWCRKAADQGYARAQCILGIFFEDGFGVNPNPAVAAEWYQKAADAGDPRAKEKLRKLKTQTPSGPQSEKKPEEKNLSQTPQKPKLEKKEGSREENLMNFYRWVYPEIFKMHQIVNFQYKLDNGPGSSGQRRQVVFSYKIIENRQRRNELIAKIDKLLTAAGFVRKNGSKHYGGYKYGFAANSSSIIFDNQSPVGYENPTRLLILRAPLYQTRMKNYKYITDVLPAKDPLLVLKMLDQNGKVVYEQDYTRAFPSSQERIIPLYNCFSQEYVEGNGYSNDKKSLLTNLNAWQARELPKFVTIITPEMRTAKQIAFFFQWADQSLPAIEAGRFPFDGESLFAKTVPR